MVLQGGGTPQFVILQGGGNMWHECGISRKYVVSNHFRAYI